MFYSVSLCLRGHKLAADGFIFFCVPREAIDLFKTPEGCLSYCRDWLFVVVDLFGPCFTKYYNKTKQNPFMKKVYVGMEKWLRGQELVALPEDRGLIPSIRMEANTSVL